MRPDRALLALLALSLGAAPATAVDRSHPPAPGPVHPLALPPVQKLALANGLAVQLVESHEVPTVEIQLVLRAGAGADPAGHAGLASMTAAMLDEGAGGKDALALADAIDFLGAELSTGSSWDHSVVRLHVPVARLADALPLMADVALRPDFPEQELERLRKQALTGILEARDDPDAIATWALPEAVFGTHRYALPESGTAATVAAFSAPQLREFHDRYYRPADALLIVVGDVTPATVLPLLEKAFGGWPAGGAPPPPVPQPPQVGRRVIWLVDKPGAAQSVIRVGRVGPPRSSPDYHALEVMNTLLGGSFTSRLNDNLREKHGYAYGAGSAFRYRRVGGAFLAAADVQTPSTADAMREFVKELERIRTPATRAEVERARNYLALGYAQEFETTRQIAAKLAGKAVYGLPDDVFTSFMPKVLATGVDEVRRVARAEIDPDRMAFVIVGDRATIEAPLRALHLGEVKVMSVDDVMGPAPKLD